MRRSPARFVHLRFVHPLRRRLGGLPTEPEKARTLIEYGREHGAATLIETGTYRGTTVAACLHHFSRIFTIELGEELFAAARARFADEQTVTVIHGDSYTELSRLATSVPGPVLFWLDAHYSDDSAAKGPHDPPLPWELRAILERDTPDVVLIDDARLMGLLPGYPSIKDIRGIVGDRAASFEVRRDMIRITLTERVSGERTHPEPPVESRP